MAGDLDSGLLHRLERYRLSTTAAHPLREGSTPGRRAPGKHLTLMASMAYSTWNKRPSGEKVFTPRSYSLLATAHIVSATQAPAPPRPVWLPEMLPALPPKQQAPVPGAVLNGTLVRSRSNSRHLRSGGKCLARPGSPCALPCCNAGAPSSCCGAQPPLSRPPQPLPPCPPHSGGMRRTAARRLSRLRRARRPHLVKNIVGCPAQLAEAQHGGVARRGTAAALRQ